MRLAVTGDEAAFAELFRRYEPRVVGYCRRMLRSEWEKVKPIFE